MDSKYSPQPVRSNHLLISINCTEHSFHYVCRCFLFSIRSTIIISTRQSTVHYKSVHKIYLSTHFPSSWFSGPRTIWRLWLCSRGASITSLYTVRANQKPCLGQAANERLLFQLSSMALSRVTTPGPPAGTTITSCSSGKRWWWWLQSWLAKHVGHFRT